MVGLAAASSSTKVQPPRLSTMSSPTPAPPGLSIRQATADEAHPLLTNMINEAFKPYHVRYAKDLENAERVSSDGKQGVG